MKNLFILFTLILLPIFAQAQSSGCISGNCEDGYGTYVWGSDTKWAGDKYVGDWKNGVMHGFGTYTWASGTKYVGSWENGAQQGKGTLTYADGTVKKGQWANGEYVDESTPSYSTGCVSGDCANGYGTYSWSSGEKYEGYWVDYKRNGQGTNYYSNGDKYVGNFKDDYKHGYGKYTFTDGSVQDGDWEWDKFKGAMSYTTGCISGDCDNGYGVYTWDTGEKYEGAWINRKRNGQGTNYYASGAVYVGNWKDDKKHGYGTITFTSGSEYDKYTGDLYEDQIQGFGTLTYKNGQKYVGEFVANLFQGQGTMYYADGRIESGQWENDVYKGKGTVSNNKSTGCISGNCDDGYGVYTWDTGEKYEGYWSDGMRNGQGTNYFSSGAVYTGEWKDDMKHGVGSYTYKPGSSYERYEGNWINDKLTGRGVLYYRTPKGQRYEGSFLENMYHGEGTMYYADGTIQSGIWDNDKYIGKSQDNYGCISGNCENGYGTYTFQNGGKYVGDWKEGNYHGKGTYYFANGDKYIGDWVEGSMEGQGTYTFAADNSKYVGEWKADQYHGTGTLYNANGINQSGLWANGEYQGEIKTKGAAPAINWLAPEYFTSSSSAADYMIKLCIQSSTPLTNTRVYINNVLQENYVERGFNVVSTACDYTIERKVTLQSGSNRIKVEATNDYGTTVSDERTVEFTVSSSEKRLALVIGNSNYASSPLRNPANDAKSIAKSLTALGFEVMVFTDLGQSDMIRQIRSFGEKLVAQKGVGLFYFAGHGIQLQGENYLIPVNAVIEKEQDVELEAVNLKRVLGEMEYARNDMNIVVLDACRNNPFARSFRSNTGSGLSTTTAPLGTFIAYATSPGSVAADGEGDNGLYTEALIEAITVPGLKIEETFKRVRTSVISKSGGKQVPWDNSSIVNDFYFKK